MPTGPQTSSPRRFLKGVGIVCLLAIYTPIVLLFSGCSTGRVLFSSTQPEGIKYDGNQYVLQELEGGINWGSPLSLEHRASIWVTRKGDEGVYGHVVEINIADPNEVKKADWTPDGVEVEFKAGHRLFIPKASFIGGR